MLQHVSTQIRPTDLLGVWQLERRLYDRPGGFGRVTGWLELTLVGGVVHWLELGELRWGGQTYEVTRELHIVRGDTDGWDVRFTDGRMFHPWRPGGHVQHPCGRDLYRGLIAVDESRTRLRVLWDVSGPLKSQRIMTRCRRRPDVRPRGLAASS